MVSIRDLLSVSATTATLVAIGYGVVVKAGFVVGRAEAGDMINLAVQQATAQTNQALLDEVKARQKADLQLRLDIANQKISPLLNKEDPSPAEEFAIGQLTSEIERLNQELSELE